MMSDKGYIQSKRALFPYDSFYVNYSAHELSVTKINFLALYIATSIVAVPSYSSLKGLHIQYHHAGI